MPAWREQARLLLDKAREDAYVLRRLAEDANAPPSSLGFHAQQAVEKALKAVLAAHEVKYPFTHDLATLLRLVAHRNIEQPPDGEQLPRLSPYGTLWRYEAESDEGEYVVDRAWQTACVERTLSWACSMLEGRQERQS